MHNLKPYVVEPYNVFAEAVSRKKDPALKLRLEEVSPEILSCYKLYKEHFDKNKLELLIPNPSCKKNIDDLLSLYSFRNKVIRDLKKKIDNTQLSVISNTCQNCTINSVNTMDHVLSQKKFPEFIVNPINLFPSCSECNNYKSNAFAKNGNRKFLNLYLDNLPQEQYLFVSIKRDISDDLVWNFTIENRSFIDKDLFAIIKSHYEMLNLFQRMKITSVKYVTELANSIKVRKANLSITEICDEVIKTSDENRKVFGYNHFQYILETSLVQSSDFLATIK